MKKVLAFVVVLASLLAGTLPAGGGSWLYIKSQASFYPTDLTGKLVLFIMDSGNVTTSGSDVTAVTDLSGNGYNASTGASNKPTFNATGLNGQGVIEMGSGLAPTPYLSFGGTTAFLDAARGTSIYMVLKHVSVGSDNVFLSLKLSGATNSPVLDLRNGGADYLFSGDTEIGQKAIWTGLNPGTTNWHTVLYTYNGSGYGTATNSTLYFDKVLQTTNSNSYVQYGTNSVIGTYQAGASTAFSAPVNLAFFLILDHEMTGTERANLDAWVLSKYGL